MASYMKTPVKGYVEEENHKEWIELLSWDLETSNESQDNSHDLAGEVKADEVSGMMLTTAAVPSLITKMFAGEIMPLIIFEDCNPRGKHPVQRRLTAKNARLKKCKTSQQKAGNETEFRFIFEQMKYEVAAPDGSMQPTTWNSKKKTPKFDE